MYYNGIARFFHNTVMNLSFPNRYRLVGRITHHGDRQHFSAQLKMGKQWFMYDDLRGGKFEPISSMTILKAPDEANSYIYYQM